MKITAFVLRFCTSELSLLKELDLSDNLLSLTFGTSWIPPFQLVKLGLGSCKLSPSFPSWLQALSQLSFLDISDAGIDDFVPDWFWNKLQFIRDLDMSCNSLKGTIPNLTTVDDGQGKLPDCWEHLSFLQFLDLRNNKLSGKIPQSMGSLANLEALVLRNNNFFGELPLTLKNCSNLALLDGQDYEFWNPENLLKSIDLSSNDLTGEVPKEVGHLLGLVSLNLSRNNFHGEIPSGIGNLSSLEFLDLSRNNLSGSIPSTLSNIDRLGVLDLSNNNLSGRIPWGRQLQTFDASCSEGNIENIEYVFPITSFL
ncbi:hypothetical protein VNO80_13093 [Phaseolus coccineus]|uniref:Uncharacterized protein n=1 Tax=Phaseolus coccineus TaxID=3886 RepID=A0AAN9N663_PHACN